MPSGVSEMTNAIEVPMKQINKLLLFILGNLEYLLPQSISPPRWNGDIHKTYQRAENLPIGSEIATISAEGQNGVEVSLIIYGTETERRVYFNYTTDGIKALGTVYLKEEMDREETGVWELYFKAYDSKIEVNLAKVMNTVIHSGTEPPPVLA
ncbi:uncharacterized protein [Mytilus edulis]|uniref:uncharacterized protein n=1 Tax=Mytilus edulis TaxID=6550 RepID=UPI0039F04001